MHPYRALEVFVRTAELGSFTRAAESLALSRPAVTRLVAELEQSVGRQLLIRTTRSVSLTDEGARMLESGRDLLERADRLFTPPDENAELSGLLRVTSSATFLRFFLAGVAEEFLDLHPKVSLDLGIEPKIQSLVATRTDIAFGSCGDAPTDAIILQKRVSNIAASPDYLDRHGRPRTPADLERHELIAQPWPEAWTFFSPTGEARRIPVKGRLRVSSAAAALEAALRGRGIAMVPDIAVVEPVRKGRLEVLLPDWRTQETTVFARLAPGRIANPLAKAFLDHVRRRMEERSLAFEQERSQA